MHVNVDNFRCIFSDGGGRTGTFIALDKLHRAGRRNGKVNVAKCLTEMCEQRMNIVENVVSNARFAGNDMKSANSSFFLFCKHGF